ncbi:hypothetical protein [Longispora albida]|uniref:hypothetical protein n=1 Tax=Longispora albida TaxID=203523 RepID=UPI0003A36983|nr:hypothetical protein [Longispora albida]
MSTEPGYEEQQDPGPPPWDWTGLPPDQLAENWAELAAWAGWLQEAYAPWVVLPDCWPAHEGLRTELRIFWYWHLFAVSASWEPSEALGWHNDLRSAAVAWRELAACRHEPPVRHQEQVQAERLARTRGYVMAALEGR